MSEKEDRIFNIFKSGIDEAVAKSTEEEHLDSIQTYINIMEKVNQISYKVYASFNDVDASINYSMDLWSIPISDELAGRIYNYIGPYLELAKRELKEIAENILDSKTVGELLIKYNSLARIFNNNTFLENIVLFADIEIDGKTKELTK